MKNNSNKWLMIIAAVLAVIILGLLIYVSTNRELYKSGNLSDQKEGGNTAEVEEELQDVNIITNISTKINLLLAMDSTTEYEPSKSWGDYGFRYGILKNKLTSEYKQEIVMASLEWENITGDAWKSNPEMSQYINNALKYMSQAIAFTENKQITSEKVNEKSLELFGEEMTNPITIQGKCPTYIYDETSKLYFRPSPQCGGTSESWIKSYKSRFTKKGNEIYAYMSFAFLEPSADYSNYQVYKDVDYQEESLSLGNRTYKNEYQTATPISDYDAFNLDSTNYQDFSEYKFTFKKADNGNYYFVSVEQTK